MIATTAIFGSHGWHCRVQQVQVLLGQNTIETNYDSLCCKATLGQKLRPPFIKTPRHCHRLQPPHCRQHSQAYHVLMLHGSNFFTSGFNPPFFLHLLAERLITAALFKPIFSQCESHGQNQLSVGHHDA